MTKTIDISEEDKETEATINDELRLDTGDIIVTNDNDILKIFAEVAASDDLIATQRVIIAYEFGSGPLFRVLGRISELGEAITTSKPALVAEAFKQLRSQLTDEIKLSGVEKRPNKGIKGIGVPTIPVADQKFFKKLMDNPLFLFKTLVAFFFPRLSAQTRRKYYTVMHWAYIKQEPNFVVWLSGSHTYTIEGETTTRRGLIGAYEFIRATEPTIGDDDPKARPTDGLIRKAMSDGKSFETAKPSWLEECVEDFSEPFMMLGKVDGGNIKFYNSVTSDESKIKSAIQSGHGSLFPTDLMCNTTDQKVNNANMTPAIKNLVTYTGAPALILWQDSLTKTFVMPLYNEWVTDEKPNVKVVNTKEHLVAMINLFDAYDSSAEENNEDMILPSAVDAENDFDASVFNVGFITSDLLKLLDFKGDLKESFRLNDEGTVLEFMGVQWMTAPHVKAKRKSDEDKRLGITRQRPVAPYGYRYISACRYFSEEMESSDQYGELFSENLDFSLGRAVYKKWVECRKAAGIKTKQEHVAICAKEGKIGLWFENVESDGIVYYDNHNKLVEVGKCSIFLIGQWRVPIFHLTRIWNLLTGPWQLYLPGEVDQILYHDEPPMSRSLLRHVFRLEYKDDDTKDLSFGRMKNLNSTGEVDDGIYNIKNKYDPDEVEPIPRRKCFPLVLRCGALWIYLHNVTD